MNDHKISFVLCELLISQQFKKTTKKKPDIFLNPN